MKTKRVNRYYCDYCKKQGGSASHISRHEKRCTMNPDRECGVCDLLGVAQDCANKCLKWLREACDNCPACILAAIRQRGIPVPMVTDFDWTDEMKAV